MVNRYTKIKIPKRTNPNVLFAPSISINGEKRHTKIKANTKVVNNTLKLVVPLLKYFPFIFTS